MCAHRQLHMFFRAKAVLRTGNLQLRVVYRRHGHEPQILHEGFLMLF